MALGATGVTTFSTLRCSSGKSGLAFMADLPERSWVSEFFGASPIWHGQRFEVHQTLVRVVYNDGPGSHTNFRFTILAANSTWSSWASLAFLVAAIRALRLGSEAGLAAMAVTLDSDPDFLLHAHPVAFHYWCPFPRFQGHIVFGEQCASLLF